ncbi:MAG: MCE family protein [Candidatus Eremiobacteraeota bacterium]|nr:MCE family protein [Candidatus Eremiobacteraeota bacterium]
MVAVTAFILLLVVVSQIGRVGGESGTEYRVLFESVGGLQVRAPVHLAGVRIGYVKDLELVDSNNNQVKATILVTRKNVNLYRSRQPDEPVGSYYVYTITGNLLGDKWIEIKPGSVPAEEEPLPEGGQVIGESPVTLDDLAREGNEVMSEFRQSVNALNQLVADEKFQGDIKLTMGNFREISENLKGASADAKVLVAGLNSRVERLGDSLELVMAHVDDTVLAFQSDARVVGQDLRTVSSGVRDVVDKNRGNIDTIVMNLRETSISLKKAMRTVEELADNEELKDDVVAAADNLRRTSEEIQGIASDIRSITSDPEVQGDLRDTIHNAKEASASAKRVMGRVEGVVDNVAGGHLFGLDLEQQWNIDIGEAHTNLNAYLLPNGPYGAKLGIDSLGNDNLVNLQAMRTWENYRLRAGVVRSQFGLGADAWLFNKRLELNLDAYDTGDPKVDVLGKLLFKGDFFIQGGVRDITDGKNSYPVIGAGKRF